MNIFKNTCLLDTMLIMLAYSLNFIETTEPVKTRLRRLTNTHTRIMALAMCKRKRWLSNTNTLNTSFHRAD